MGVWHLTASMSFMYDFPEEIICLIFCPGVRFFTAHTYEWFFTLRSYQALQQSWRADSYQLWCVMTVLGYLTSYNSLFPQSRHRRCVTYNLSFTLLSSDGNDSAKILRIPVPNDLGANDPNVNSNSNLQKSQVKQPGITLRHSVPVTPRHESK